MSKYTTQLRYLKESNFDLGMKNYPIFDESYREHLNNKIVSHYMFQEIGFETPELFKMYLNTRLNEIMPYYNQLYKSEQLKFEPFENVNKTTIMDRDVIGNLKNVQDSTDNRTYTETKNTDTTGENDGTSDTNGNRTDNTTTENNNLNITSDTPQDLISFLDITNDKYASGADRGQSTNNSNLTSIYNENNITHNEAHGNEHTTINGTDNKIGNITGNQDNKTAEDYTMNIKGKSEGETYSEMLLKYRQTFLNIDMQVINELQDLFMLIW